MRLVSYRSGRILFGSNFYHLETLIPEGWQPTKTDPLIFRPPGKLTWLPAVVRRWFVSEQDDGFNHFAVTWMLPYDGGISDDQTTMDLDVKDSPCCQAWRQIHGKITWLIDYRIADRNEFDATYRHICESVKVVPDDSK